MAKLKPVNWEFIEKDDVLIREQDLYSVVHDLIMQYHITDNIENVNYILMWRYNIKMDQDDYVLLADISKSPDKYRELRCHDFIIGINKDAWSVLDAQQKLVVLDAQLERIAVCVDKDDNPKEDTSHRTVYRLRRPEVLDEATIKRRHGITLQDVQEYVHDKFKTAGAEKGSYIDKALNGDLRN